jgi:hypothetical protein
MSIIKTITLLTVVGLSSQFDFKALNKKFIKIDKRDVDWPSLTNTCQQAYNRQQGYIQECEAGYRRQLDQDLVGANIEQARYLFCVQVVNVQGCHSLYIQDSCTATDMSRLNNFVYERYDEEFDDRYDDTNESNNDDLNCRNFSPSTTAATSPSTTRSTTATPSTTANPITQSSTTNGPTSESTRPPRPDDDDNDDNDEKEIEFKGRITSRRNNRTRITDIEFRLNSYIADWF